MTSPMQFWYPVIFYTDEPFDEPRVKRLQGNIYAINICKEPYEVDVETNGYSYHLIFGRQTNGYFLCIPNWKMGCELASYNDKYWNTESILKAGQISREAAYAISNAIDLLAFMLK